MVNRVAYGDSGFFPVAQSQVDEESALFKFVSSVALSNVLLTVGNRKVTNIKVVVYLEAEVTDAEAADGLV